MAAMRTSKEPRLWSERFLGYQAKWFVFPILGLFTLAQIAAHDGQVYSAIESGQSDINALSQLYFKEWSHSQDSQIIGMMFVGMMVLAGLAIFIRYAKWHYANHGIALD